MTHLEHTVAIERPIQEVWEFVVDAGNDPRWITNVIEVKRGAGEPPAVGLEIEQVIKFYGVRLPATLTITEHAPPERSAVDIDGPVKATGTYRLEAVDGGTRFTMELDTDAHGFFKLAEPVFARMANRDMAASAAHLKDILEANGTP